jgi:glycolate oxidase FAD binding subunit
LRESVGSFGETLALDSTTSEIFWGDLCDLKLFLTEPSRPLWRISVAPTEAPKLVTTLSSRLDFDHLYDWGGGLIWIALRTGAEPAPEVLRAALPSGHATLIRADDAVRAQVPVFQPQAPGVADLTRRIKESFDPLHLLNPGRMQAGF